MSATRDHYHLAGDAYNPAQINFYLQRLSDRIEKLEGLRGQAQVDDKLIVAAGVRASNSRIVRSDYTVGLNDCLIGVDTVSTITITLSEEANVDGNLIVIYDYARNANVNNVTITTERNTTIDLLFQNLIMSGKGASIIMANNGEGWRSVAVQSFQALPGFTYS